MRARARAVVDSDGAIEFISYVSHEAPHIFYTL